MDYKLFWTEEALRNLDDILTYLTTRWTPREVEQFKKKLSRKLDLIISHPTLFPLSAYNGRMRKAVLSKQTTLYFEVREYTIYLAHLHQNRMDIGRIE